MTIPANKNNNLVSRISVSMSQELLVELDTMVESRGFDSRSQAICDMINQQLVDHKRQLGDEVMAGTITVFYDRSIKGLQKKLSDLQFKYIDEVISSLHVHLAENKMMEVILVQGPTRSMKAIENEIIALRGVITGKLQLIAAVIPPLHPLP
ncbi:MAG: nickel-responsive transcriptional regulator NikR [Sulfuriferula sp.]